MSVINDVSQLLQSHRYARRGDDTTVKPWSELTTKELKIPVYEAVRAHLAENAPAPEGDVQKLERAVVVGGYAIMCSSAVVFSYLTPLCRELLVLKILEEYRKLGVSAEFAEMEQLALTELVTSIANG